MEKINLPKINFADKIISNIFRSGGRGEFSKRAKEAFEWSEKGGPEIGTSSFIKAVVGNVALSPEEFGVLRGEINKEIKKIRKQQQAEKILKEEPKKIFSEDERSIIIDDSRKEIKEELKRSGGIDPNEI